MAVTIVELTATHASNAALLPGNAQLDDGITSTVQGSAGRSPLYRNDGSIASFSSWPLVITKVEVVCEVIALDTGSGSTYTLKGAWAGSVFTTTLNVTSTGVKRLDVTADRAWSASDFDSVNLEGIFEDTGGFGSAGGTIDYLWYEVTYTEVTTYIVNELEEIPETAIFGGAWLLVVSDLEEIPETSLAIIHVFVVRNDTEEVYDRVWENAILVRMGISVSEVETIIESVLTGVKVIALSNDTEEIPEIQITLVGFVIVDSDDEEIPETKVTTIGFVINQDDTMTLLEATGKLLNFAGNDGVNGVILPSSSGTLGVPQEVAILDTEVIDGRHRLVVKKVKFDEAAFIDEKTIVGIDHELRHLNVLISGLNQKIDEA